MGRSSQDVPLGPGDIIGGRYRVIQAVGEGPLDRLYEAQDVDRHERVIVRVLRKSLAGEEERVRAFEDQARVLRSTAEESCVRVLELSRDEEHGHFAAISNRENRPLSEVLVLLAGVDGQQEPPPAHPPVPVDGFRFPESESQVELDTLEPPPPAAAAASAAGEQQREQPRFAEPKRPKRLDTIELDRPHVSRSTGPRPAMKLVRQRDWTALRRVGFLVLMLGVAGAGIYFYAKHQERQDAPQDEPAPDAMTMDMGYTLDDMGYLKAPGREVRLRFRVTPANARMRIHGQLVPKHSIRVPASLQPIKVRFEAPRHQPRTIAVVPDRTRDVVVVLNKKP